MAPKRKAAGSTSAAAKKAKAAISSDEDAMEVEEVVQTPAKRGGRGRKSTAADADVHVHVQKVDSEGRVTGSGPSPDEEIVATETVITKVIERTVVDKEKEEALTKQLSAVKSLEMAAEHKVEAANARIRSLEAKVAGLEKQADESASLRAQVKALERVVLAKDSEIAKLHQDMKSAIATVRQESKTHELVEIERIITEKAKETKAATEKASHSHDKQIMELTHTVETLRRDLEKAKKTASDHEQVIIVKEKEYHALLAAKEKEFKHIVEQVRKEDAEKEAKDLHQLEQVRAKELEKASHSQDKTIVELKHKCERLETEHAAKDKESHRLETELKSCHHKIAELEKHLEESRQTVTSTKTTIVQLQKDHEHLLAAKEKEFEHIVEKARKEAAIHEAHELERLEKTREKDVSEVKHNVQSLTIQIEKLKKDCHAHVSKIEELEHALEAERHLVASKVKQYEALQVSKSKEFEHILDQTRREDKAREAREIQRLEVEREKAVEKASHSQDATVKDLHGQIVVLNQKCQVLEGKLGDVEAHNAQLTKLLQHKESEHTAAVAHEKQALAQKQEEYNKLVKAKESEFEHIITKIKAEEAKALERASHSQDATVSNLSHDIETLHKQITVLTREKADLGKECHALQQSIEKHQTEIRVIKEQGATRVSELERSISQAKATIAAHVSEVEKLKAKHEDHTRVIEERTKTITIREQHIEKLNAEIVQLRDIIEKMDVQLRKLVESRDGLIAALRGALEKHGQHIQVEEYHIHLKSVPASYSVTEKETVTTREVKETSSTSGTPRKRGRN